MNRLPAKTWYRLKVNDSSAELPERLVQPELSVEAPDGITVSRQGEEFTVRSAMGDEYGRYMAGVPALWISAKGPQAKPAVIRLTLRDGENAGLRLFLDAEDSAVIRVILVLDSENRQGGGHCALRTLVRAGNSAGAALYVVNLLGEGAVLTDRWTEIMKRTAKPRSQSKPL